MPSRWDSVQSDGEMRCYVSWPGGAGPFPAIVVIQHAGGVDGFIQSMSDRLAEAGYVVIAPDLYHRYDADAGDDAMTKMSRLRDRNIVPDVNTAIQHLKGLPAVRADRIGITGFCMGGRVTYLMASQNPDVKAAVVFWGGSIMAPWGGDTSPFDLSDQIACPVMGIFGEDDANPNPADVAKLDAELTSLEKMHEFHSYAGAGHAFMNEGRPSYRPEATKDAWRKALAWFDRHLKR